MRPQRADDQATRIEEVLRKYGQISRNQAIFDMQILRLGARVRELREKGWKLEGEERNGDFVYKVMAEPGGQLRLI